MRSYLAVRSVVDELSEDIPFPTNTRLLTYVRDGNDPEPKPETRGCPESFLKEKHFVLSWRGA